MSTTPSKRFRSTFHDINLELLKKLCDIHPWTRGELCKAVDMEPAVLSMVLAGKRPLPGRVAKQFLELIGMKEDGTLDHMHGFVFKDQPGREAELQAVLDLLYPDEPSVFALKAAVPHPQNPQSPLSYKLGLAILNRRYQSVVHTYAGSKLNERWPLLKAEDVKLGVQSERLLSLTELPTKLLIVQAIAYHTLEFAPKWPDVIEAARKRNVSPRDVLAWLETTFSEPTDEQGEAHRLK